jgi:glutamate synthase (NADPH/NADH) small chain
LKHFRESLGEKDTRDQAALHVRHPIATAPVQSRRTPAARSTARSPDFNDLSIRATGRGLAQPALDQQFSGVHRPHLPAPCEASCTLNINDNPVTIKTIECATSIAQGKIA